MSKYTTELRYICETLASESESKGYNNIKSIIAIARPKIFDFDYPTYNSVYKEVLETKFIKHFYTREIGYETYGLWKLKLDDKMNIIMPYYNKMYEVNDISYNPMYNVDITTTHTLNKKSDTKTDTKGNNLDWEMYSDTPQGSIKDLDTGKYLTNATKNTAENQSNTVTGVASTDDYIERVIGKRGDKSISEMIAVYRENLINIDSMIIDELSDLFLNLW